MTFLHKKTRPIVWDEIKIPAVPPTLAHTLTYRAINGCGTLGPL